MAKIDTNEFKGDQLMTRKVEKWFQNVGRPYKKTTRCEGREWIEAIDCGFNKRRDEYEEFDIEKLLRPAGAKSNNAGHNGEEADEAGNRDVREQAKQVERAVRARDLEERQWEARHRPKSAVMSMTSGGTTSRGRHHEAAPSRPARKYAASGAEESEEDMLDAGARMREQALWLPVTENHLSRSSRPSPEWCGAVLFQGAPGERQNQPSESQPSQTSRGAAQAAGKALDLWNGFTGKRRIKRTGWRTRRSTTWKDQVNQNVIEQQVKEEKNETWAKLQKVCLASLVTRR